MQWRMDMCRGHFQKHLKHGARWNTEESVDMALAAFGLGPPPPVRGAGALSFERKEIEDVDLEHAFQIKAVPPLYVSRDAPCTPRDLFCVMSRVPSSSLERLLITFLFKTLPFDHKDIRKDMNFYTDVGDNWRQITVRVVFGTKTCEKRRARYHRRRG